MSIIGLFDSGVGGLTVARQIFEQLPQSQIIYYGDTARVPYGGKPVEELIYLADVITKFLIEKGARVVIDACNSTSAVALEHLQSKYPVPILGVIEPGVEAAISTTKNGKIGLIATEATVKSEMHYKKIKEVNPEAEVFAYACPRFVPLIEAGEVEGSKLKSLAAEYLMPLKKAGIDTLILGCTHYPFIADTVAEILGSGVSLIDPAVETVNRLSQLVPGTNALNDLDHRYYVSGDANHFTKIGNILLPGYKVSNVETLVVG